MNIDLSRPAPREDAGRSTVDHCALWWLVQEQAREFAQLKQRIEELEEKCNTYSRNSSRPPSTDSKKGKPSAGSGR